MKKLTGLLLTGAVALLAWGTATPALARSTSSVADVTSAPLAPPACTDFTPLNSAANFWIGRTARYPDSTWFNSLFVKGLIEAYKATGNAAYLTWATGWATHNGWALPAHAPNFDGPEASQEYTDLFELDPTHPARDIAGAHAYVTRETARVEAGHAGDFSYVDAVRLGALSEFARLGVPNHNATELDAMHKLFASTESHLYDTRGMVDLWWRDGRWAGTTTHWSRGNGWIAIALTDTVAALPAGNADRAHYIGILNGMAATLKANQQAGGYWTANVDHPASFPAPESSGTSFFTYALARGIQMGYIDSATYLPVVQRAWTWLRTVALHPSGLVGYVQGPSSQPSQHQPISPTATTNYGVGAFLMAGVEADKVIPTC
jgi:unsaturated rhamnogalacturonyl hydrolase